jgi:hypothetical protein
VRQCAEALVRGIEHRRRRIYVPRSIAGVQALRTIYTGAVAEAAIRRFGGDQVSQMEDEVRALGRSFGAHSMGNEPTHVD